MLFFAGLAAMLSVFALGLLWPHRVATALGPTIWGYFVKALYLAWIWFLISYFSGLVDAARLISLTLAVFVGLQLINKKSPMLIL